MSRPVSPLRRRLRHRTRVALALSVLLVALAHATGSALLQSVDRLRDPLYYQRAILLKNRVAEAERPFVLVMLGSSRTQSGFAPIDIERQLAGALGRPVVAFNFGVQGSGPLAHDLYLSRLLAAGPRPDALYLEVTPSMLFQRDGEPMERATRTLDPRFLQWDELAAIKRHGAAWPGMRQEWLKARANPLVEYRFQFVWRVVPAWAPSGYRALRGTPRDACGWTPSWFEGFTDDMRPAAQELARREHALALSAGQIHSAPVAALRAICARCQREGVPLALVIMPEGPSFRALYSPEVEEWFGAVVKQLRADFGIPVVNARTWIAEDGFTDGHHLLPVGAKQFTARFAVEAILPHAARRQTENDRAAK